MPGLATSPSSCSLSANGFWAKNSDYVSYNQLEKVLDSSSFFQIAAGSLFRINCCVNGDYLLGFVLDLTV